MKPFTITIASDAALELFKQFSEMLPSDGDKWAQSMRKSCEKLKVEHDRIDDVTAHRQQIAIMARKVAASVELGADIVLDDNRGYMPDYEAVSEEIAGALADASMADGKDAVMRMMGIDEDQFDEYVARALDDPDCPEAVKMMLGGKRGSPSSTGDISSTTLDELSKEGKNVVKFPTGRKDN